VIQDPTPIELLLDHRVLKLELFDDRRQAMSAILVGRRAQWIAVRQVVETKHGCGPSHTMRGSLNTVYLFIALREFAVEKMRFHPKGQTREI
jgi:hypothetical protein